MPGVLRRRPDPTLLPDHSVSYHQLLRGPRRRWWRPLLSLVVLAGLLAVLLIAVFGAFDGLDVLLRGRWLGDPDDELSPISMLEVDLALAALIPAAAGAVAIAHRVRPRWVSSIVGGLRWRWLLRCVLVVTPVFVVYLGLALVLDPPAPGRPERWVPLLVMSLVLTPFQAAGEEYLCRGWLVQNIGACFSRPVLGLVVSTAVSATGFALLHGSLHPWVLIELGAFGVAGCLATWRTGGLEAAIAVHAVNNVLLGVVTTTYGGYAEQFVDADTTGSPGSALTTALVLAVALSLVWWQARRVGVVRTTTPAPAVWTYGPLDSVEPPDATWLAPLGR